jgi:hypothetical protein
MLRRERGMVSASRFLAKKAKAEGQSRVVWRSGAARRPPIPIGDPCCLSISCAHGN